MLQTFINLPTEISNAISQILTQQETSEWVTRASVLHERYTMRQKNGESYLSDFTDALAYLSLRSPATYAQIYSSLSQVKEVIPSWEPRTLLDIGSGPGVGVWAATSVWRSIQSTTCVDANKNMLSLGKQITSLARLPVENSWKQQDARQNRESAASYDVVVIANVLNELSIADGEKLLGYAFNACKGIMVLIEPGTPFGSSIIQSAAQKFSRSHTLLAPYVENSFVFSKKYWIHFPQRFIRPEFQRRIRQRMRDSVLMASDWEEAKYSYVAISKVPSEVKAWGRCIGPIQLQKGFRTVPILTKDDIVDVKVLKRYKQHYTFVKNLKWGEMILNKEDIKEEEK